jgi:hypothetical protein
MPLLPVGLLPVGLLPVGLLPVELLPVELLPVGLLQLLQFTAVMMSALWTFHKTCMWLLSSACVACNALILIAVSSRLFLILSLISVSGWRCPIITFSSKPLKLLTISCPIITFSSKPLKSNTIRNLALETIKTKPSAQPPLCDSIWRPSCTAARFPIPTTCRIRAEQAPCEILTLNRFHFCFSRCLLPIKQTCCIDT